MSENTQKETEQTIQENQEAQNVQETQNAQETQDVQEQPVATQEQNNE